VDECGRGLDVGGERRSGDQERRDKQINSVHAASMRERSSAFKASAFCLRASCFGNTTRCQEVLLTGVSAWGEGYGPSCRHKFWIASQIASTKVIG
jgi:hypothetical protein